MRFVNNELIIKICIKNIVKLICTNFIKQSQTIVMGYTFFFNTHALNFSYFNQMYDFNIIIIGLPHIANFSYKL